MGTGEDGEYTKTLKRRLPLNSFEQFCDHQHKEAENDQYFGRVFSIDRDCIKNVHKFMSNVILSFETNAEKFYPVFYEYILDTFS